MPKIKPEHKYAKCYSEESLQRALEEIRSGSSKKTVSKKYGIPRSTLQFRLSEKFSKIEKGPSTYLTKIEEEKLERWIIDSQIKGFPRRKVDIQMSVKYFLDVDQRPNPFKDNVPGNKWFESFLKRHPNLTNRISEAVTSASSNVSESDIKKWFREIEVYLKEKGYFEILNDAPRVYNGDETCFLFCPKFGKVIASKGSKNVYEVDQGEAKQNLTVMFTFSASGHITPPMIVFPNKRRTEKISNSIPQSWGYGLSDNGWMKAELFVDYIKNILYPHLMEKNVQFPIILFLDGHKTHLTYEVSQLCRSLNIILIALYPNATRILQPADVSSFKPLKNAWKHQVLEWRRKNPFKKLGKEQFAPILEIAITKLKSSTISNGFKACGLYPWNPEAIDYSKCLGKRTINDINVNEKDKRKEDHITMDFNKFCDIVGPEKIVEIQQNLDEVNDENFEILKQIFKHLSPPTADSEFFTVEDFDEMPVVIEDFANEISIVIEDSPDNTTIDMDSNVSMSKDEVENETLNLTQENDPISDDTTLVSQHEARIENFDSTKKNVPDNTAMDTEVIVSQDEVENGNFDSMTENDVPNLIVDNLLMPSSKNDNLLEKPNSSVIILENYLVKASTPQRKGKMQTERTPYVITSSAFKKMMEDKQSIKQEKERAKEENKRKRELQKLEKKNKQKNNQKTKKKTCSKKNIELISNIENCEERDIQENIISNKSHEESYILSKNIEEAEETWNKDDNEDRKTDNAINSYILKPRHVRNIFQEVGQENNQPAPVGIKNTSTSGLCFICTLSLSSSRASIGVKCQYCLRQYHLQCLRKHKHYEDETKTFVCKTCLPKHTK